MKKIMILAMTVLLSLSTAVAHATVDVQGNAKIKYGSWLSDADKQRAIEKAEMDAIEAFFDDRGVAATENLEAIEQQLKEDPEKFISRIEILDETDHAGTYSVRIRASLKDSKLLVALKKASQAGNAAFSAKSPIVYVFYGRETDSRQAFHERTVRRAELTGRVDTDSVTTTDGHETITTDTHGSRSYRNRSAYVGINASERAAYRQNARINGRNYRASASASGSARADYGVSASASDSTFSSNSQTDIDSNGIHNSNTVTTIRGHSRLEVGGDTTRRADKVTYRMMPMDTYQTNITSVFTNAGYKVRDPAMVMDDAVMAALKKDFSTGNEVKPSTKRALIHKLKVSGVPYVVLATLDVGAPYRDPDTGMQRVDAVVTAQVLDQQGDEVASTEAQHFFGLGNQNDDAQTQALKKASMAAAQNVVYSMNNAGLQ